MHWLVRIAARFVQEVQAELAKERAEAGIDNDIASYEGILQAAQNRAAQTAYGYDPATWSAAGNCGTNSARQEGIPAGVHENVSRPPEGEGWREWMKQKKKRESRAE